MPTDTVDSPITTAAPESSDSNSTETNPSQAVLDIEALFGEDTPSNGSNGSNVPDAAHAATQTSTTPIRVAGPPAARQYVDDEEKKIFKDMSNDAYNRVYPEWRKLKSGEYVPKTELERLKKEYEEKQTQVKSERWFDHPKAYLLSDDYAGAQQDVAIYRDIVDHYRHALEQIMDGKPFYRIAPHPEQKFIIDTRQAVPASPQAHAYVTAELSKFYNSQMNAENQVKQMETTYGQRFTPIKQALDSVEKSTFERYEKAPGFERAWKGELGLYPRELQGLPEYRLLAKASIILKAMEMKQQKNKLASAQQATRPDTSSGVSGGALSDAANNIARLNEIADRR